jgi:uncharacterized membrane protein
VTPENRFRAGSLALAVLSVAHGVLTWGPVAASTFAGVAVALAFVSEVAVVATGLLEHYTRPKLAGVAVPALLGWIGVTYLGYRAALLVVPAGVAPLAAAVLATAFDVVADPVGVSDGLWSYPDSPVSEPRYRGVPWWNFAGWLVLVAAVTWGAGHPP